MNSKKSVEKKVVSGILLIGIIIASISFVSAWWIFGDDNENLEGELPESATANVEIQPSANPPNISWVSSLGNSVGLSAGTSNNVNFNFSANIDGFATGLPVTSDFQSNGWGSYIRGNFSNPLSGEITRPIVSCIYLATDPANKYVNYSCNVTAWYYDTPFYAWKINVQMSTAWNQNNFGPVNNTANFTYMEVTNAVYTPDTINWTSLQITTKNATSTSITVTNNGNVRIAPNGTDVNPNAGVKYNFIGINSTILNGTAFETISPGNFTQTTPAGSCNIPTPQFIRNQYQNLSTSVNKSNNPTATTNSTAFCLKQLDYITIAPQNFSTSLSVPALPWTIENRVI